MACDVYVWGDSHWRSFFPSVNHGAPGVFWEQDGVRTIDMVSNELSGATMYGLLNPNSKNGARNRILGDLDRLGPVDSVGLVFGEVDVRYPQHHDRYFRPDGSVMMCEVFNLLARYLRFLEEDLLASGRVRDRIFIYFGFAYPKREETLLQPGQPMGLQAWTKACTLERMISAFVGGGDFNVLRTGKWPHKIIPIIGYPSHIMDMVSPDGVHLLPERVYPEIVLPALRNEFGLDRPVVFGRRALPL